MTVTGKTPVYALLGHPIAHSRSPELHNRWFRELGIDGVYVALPLPGEGPNALRALLTSGALAGANLTIPLKTDAMHLMDVLTPQAEAAGAVNTVRIDAQGLTGHNTDGQGFTDALHQHFGPPPQRPAAILGTGGAGRAVAAGLAELGIPEVHLFNRTPERAEGTAEHLAKYFPETAFHAHPLTDVHFQRLASELGVIAQCTGGAGRRSVRDLNIESLRRDCQWCDLNYWDEDPPHAASLRERFCSGMGMLTQQAALAFSYWTGVRPNEPLGG